MEPFILDLRQQRCPMSLLQAKRTRASLCDSTELRILSQDPSSVADMVRYFEAVGYTVVQRQTSCIELSVYSETLNASNGKPLV